MERRGWRVGYWMIALLAFSLSIVALMAAPVAMLILWDWSGGDPLWRAGGIAANVGWAAIGLNLWDRRRRGPQFDYDFASAEPGDVLVVEANGERRYRVIGEEPQEWRPWPPEAAVEP